MACNWTICCFGDTAKDVRALCARKQERVPALFHPEVEFSLSRRNCALLGREVNCRLSCVGGAAGHSCSLCTCGFAGEADLGLSSWGLRIFLELGNF